MFPHVYILNLESSHILTNFKAESWSPWGTCRHWPKTWKWKARQGMPRFYESLRNIYISFYLFILSPLSPYNGTWKQTKPSDWLACTSTCWRMFLVHLMADCHVASLNVLCCLCVRFMSWLHIKNLSHLMRCPLLLARVNAETMSKDVFERRVLLFCTEHEMQHAKQWAIRKC